MFASDEKMKSSAWSQLSKTSVSATDVVECTQMCLKKGASCNVLQFDGGINMCWLGQVIPSLLDQKSFIHFYFPCLYFKGFLF